jgi:aconitate hydratase
MTEPLGQGTDGPTCTWGHLAHQRRDRRPDEVRDDPAVPSGGCTRTSPRPGRLWKAIASSTGQVYDWPKSTYIAEPPFFAGFGMSHRRCEGRA